MKLYLTHIQDISDEHMSLISPERAEKASRYRFSADKKRCIAGGLLLRRFLGDTVVFAEGASEALIVNSKGWATRGVEQPENEKNLRGPKEGFTESLLMNTGLIRRKLKTPDLKFEMMSIGTRSNTGVCLCYLKSLASDEVLKTLKERMKKIEIDGILDTNYIDELTRDNPYTPFKTAGVTR